MENNSLSGGNLKELPAWSGLAFLLNSLWQQTVMGVGLRFVFCDTAAILVVSQV